MIPTALWSHQWDRLSRPISYSTECGRLAFLPKANQHREDAAANLPLKDGQLQGPWLLIRRAGGDASLNLLADKTIPFTVHSSVARL